MSLWDEVGALVDARVDAAVERAVSAESQLAEAIADLEAARVDIAGASVRIDELEIQVDDLTVELMDARARIAELEQPADAAVIPFWGAPVFRDEFDGDLSKWNVRDNFTTMDTAVAMKANATVDGERLHLVGKWLDVPEKRGPKGIITHTTGYIDTRNLVKGDKHFSQKFGRWEIRCQTPTGDNTLGALAAFWLRADSHPGEIDILESWGGAALMPSKAEYDKYVRGNGVTTFHSDTNGGGKVFKARHGDAGVARTVNSEMHTYVFERTPDYTSMSVDGRQVFRVTPTTHAWLWDEAFFGSPLHMRVNLHIGPNATYYGLPDPNRRDLTGPLDFQVEYVRAYALPKG